MLSIRLSILSVCSAELSLRKHGEPLKISKNQLHITNCDSPSWRLLVSTMRGVVYYKFKRRLPVSPIRGVGDSPHRSFTYLTQEAKLIVIKLCPYNMLKYTLPRIQNGFQICAVPSRSGDMRLQSQKTCKKRKIRLGNPRNTVLLVRIWGLN